MKQVKNRLSAFDVLAVVLVLVLSALPAYSVLLSRDSGAYFTLKSDGGEAEYSLSEDITFQIESCGITLSVKVENGEASVTDSTCPDGVCVRTGGISLSGQSIVCVPARVTMTVRAGEADDADWIFG